MKHLLFLFLFIWWSSFIPPTLSSVNKPPSAILINVNHSSATFSPLTNNNNNNNINNNTYSLSFNASLSRLIPGGDVIYLSGLLEVLYEYDKERIFCNRINHLHEYHTESIQLTLKAMGGGGGQVSVYLLVSNEEFVLLDVNKYASITRYQAPQSANEAERVIQLYKNFTGDYIDTTCITEGQIFVDGKLILEVSKHDTISTIKTKIYEKRGISPDHQRLIFMSRELRDKETLEESGVCVVDKGSRFSPRSFTSSSIISVLRVIMLSPWTHIQEYKPTLTLGELHTSILSSLLSIPSSPLPQDLSFILHNSQGPLEGDSSSLSHLAVEKSNRLPIIWKASTPIVVNHISGKAIIFVEATDTYGKVKEKIERETGIPSSQSLLASVPDNLLFLSSYNFTGGSVVGFTDEQIKVYVYNLERGDGERNFSIHDTVSHVKETIIKETKMKGKEKEKEKMILFSDSVEMIDSYPLSYYLKPSPNFRLSIMVVQL